jgi:hypothetical protein
MKSDLEPCVINLGPVSIPYKRRRVRKRQPEPDPTLEFATVEELGEWLGCSEGFPDCHHRSCQSALGQFRQQPNQRMYKFADPLETP